MHTPLFQLHSTSEILAFSPHNLLMMRASPRRVLKMVLVAGIVLFVIGNLQILLSTPGISDDILSQTAALPAQKTNTSYLIPSDRVKNIVKINTELISNKTWLIANDYHNLSEIETRMKRANQEQKILNADRFPVSTPNFVLVVQVHNRVKYLQLLIRSMRAVHNIEKSLVIFSHDFYSEELNSQIRSIDFCPVLQIFYPISMQIFPNEFPGTDPRDCPRDISKAEAQRIKCINADHPDKYGHYREAKYTQTKHHWFWKLNYVFSAVRVLADFTGLAVLLEEDHYLTPDFLHMLSLAKDLRDREYKDCGVITMGSYDKQFSYSSGLSSKVYIEHWLSSKHNMGMAVDRKFWEGVRLCAQKFCTFDDYNWDWSLQHIGMTCFPTHMKVLASKSPRVFHMGECGLHFKGKNCNPDQKLATIETLLTASKDYLFPYSLSIGVYGRSTPRIPKPNGGWGDIRDQNLCLRFASNSKQFKLY